MSQEAARKLRFVAPLCGRLVTQSQTQTQSRLTRHVACCPPLIRHASIARPYSSSSNPLCKSETAHNWHLIDWQLLVSFWQLGGKVKLLSISFRIRIQKKEYEAVYTRRIGIINTWTYLYMSVWVCVYFYWQRRMPRYSLEQNWLGNCKPKWYFYTIFTIFIRYVSIWRGESDEQIEYTNCG